MSTMMYQPLLVNKKIEELGAGKKEFVKVFTVPGNDFPHLSECVNNDGFVKLLRYFANEYHDGSIKSATRDAGVRQAWSQARWINAGQPIYDVSKDLCEVFSRTKADFSVEDILIPYPTFYLCCHQWGQTLWNISTGEEPLNGFFVNEVEEDGERVLCLVAIGMPSTDSLGNNGVTSFMLLIPPKGTMSCEEFFDNVEKSIIEKGKLGPNSTRLRIWARVIMNTLVYLASTDRDTEVRHIVPDKIEKRIKDIKNPKQRSAAWRKHSLGKVVYVGHRLTQTDEGRKLLTGHRVRSHYRWQRVGKGRSQVKLTLVHGHWRGPRTEQDAPARVYEVTDESEDQTNQPALEVRVPAEEGK